MTKRGLIDQCARDQTAERDAHIASPLVEVRYVRAKNYPDAARQQYVIFIGGVPCLTGTANGPVDELAEKIRIAIRAHMAAEKQAMKDAALACFEVEGESWMEGFQRLENLAVDGVAIPKSDLSHADFCRLSVLFNQLAELRTETDRRINDWLKQNLARTNLAVRDHL